MDSYNISYNISIYIYGYSLDILLAISNFATASQLTINIKIISVKTVPVIQVSCDTFFFFIYYSVKICSYMSFTFSPF